MIQPHRVSTNTPMPLSVCCAQEYRRRRLIRLTAALLSSTITSPAFQTSDAAAIHGDAITELAPTAYTPPKRASVISRFFHNIEDRFKASKLERTTELNKLLSVRGAKKFSEEMADFVDIHRRFMNGPIPRQMAIQCSQNGDSTKFHRLLAGLPHVRDEVATFKHRFDTACRRSDISAIKTLLSNKGEWAETLIEPLLKEGRLEDFFLVLSDIPRVAKSRYIVFDVICGLQIGKMTDDRITTASKIIEKIHQEQPSAFAELKNTTHEGAANRIFFGAEDPMLVASRIFPKLRTDIGKKFVRQFMNYVPAKSYWGDRINKVIPENELPPTSKKNVELRLKRYRDKALPELEEVAFLVIR